MKDVLQLLKFCSNNLDLGTNSLQSTCVFCSNFTNLSCYFCSKFCCENCISVCEKCLQPYCKFCWTYKYNNNLIFILIE